MHTLEVLDEPQLGDRLDVGREDLVGAGVALALGVDHPHREQERGAPGDLDRVVARAQLYRVVDVLDPIAGELSVTLELEYDALETVVAAGAHVRPDERGQHHRGTRH